jgi:hypothetical protein
MAQSIPDEGLPQVTLVILGAQGVGKSTFIQNSFDLRSPSNSAFEVKKMSLDDVVYLVRLVEISLDDVVVTGSNGIKWPKSLKGFDLPPIDGVLALYDVTNQESITGIPDILRWSPSLPCCNVPAAESSPAHASFRRILTFTSLTHCIHRRVTTI